MAIRDLDTAEIIQVSGGNPENGQSWVEYLQDRFPGGEWHNGSFFPNGVPSGFHNT